MKEISIEKEFSKAAENSALGIFAGFAMGFILGASIVALIDYYDNKKEKLSRIANGADENYITSE